MPKENTQSALVSRFARPIIAVARLHAIVNRYLFNLTAGAESATLQDMDTAAPKSLPGQTRMDFAKRPRLPDLADESIEGWAFFGELLQVSLHGSMLDKAQAGALVRLAVSDADGILPSQLPDDDELCWQRLWQITAECGRGNLAFGYETVLSGLRLAVQRMFDQWETA